MRRAGLRHRGGQGKAYQEDTLAASNAHNIDNPLSAASRYGYSQPMKSRKSAVVCRSMRKTPFLFPASQTGRADFPHPAFHQDFTAQSPQLVRSFPASRSGLEAAARA
jgi:hypothetical protein